MKIYRGGQASSEWSAVTDSMNPQRLQKTWRAGGMLALDGTIDKTGERHTAVGIEIDERDIVALVQALVAENGRLRTTLASWKSIAERLSVLGTIDRAHRNTERVGDWTVEQVQALQALLDVSARKRRGRSSRS